MNDIEVITLQELKLALRVTNYDEDAELSRKLNSAVSEVQNFLNNRIPTDVDGTVRPDIVNAVVLLVQADYELDPVKRDIYRDNALKVAMPYRINVGI